MAETSLCIQLPIDGIPAIAFLRLTFYLYGN